VGLSNGFRTTFKFRWQQEWLPPMNFPMIINGKPVSSISRLPAGNGGRSLPQADFNHYPTKVGRQRFQKALVV
jgi:hypothetical protein